MIRNHGIRRPTQLGNHAEMGRSVASVRSVPYNIPGSESGQEANRSQNVEGNSSPTQRLNQQLQPTLPTTQRGLEEKRVLILRQMLLLFHANFCKRNDGIVPNLVVRRQCRITHCSTMKSVLLHMQTCQASGRCTVPHCQSSKQMLAHFKRCQNATCPVCKTVREFVHSSTQALVNGVQVTSHFLEMSGRRFLSQYQNSQQQQPSSTIEDDSPGSPQEAAPELDPSVQVEE